MARASKPSRHETLVANLLLIVMCSGLTRPWSFSGLATMVRITLMCYVDFYSLFSQPDKDWKKHPNLHLRRTASASLFDEGLGSPRINECNGNLLTLPSECGLDEVNT